MRRSISKRLLSFPASGVDAGHPPPPRTPLNAAFAVLATAVVFALAGCAGLAASDDAAPTATRVAALLPADVLLLGEQHDAPDHQRIERETVEALAARGQLAALAIEMAEQGSDTRHLPPGASEDAVRTALSWREAGWPWEDYGPVVMAAVRGGVPVFGANLPRARMKDAMADVSLDAQLLPPALAAQQEAVREGHCNMLPEAQIGPMTRIQVARDRAMAQTVVQVRVPGKTVLLVSGAGHSSKALGVPQMLPTDLRVRAVRMVAGSDTPPAAQPDAGAADIAGTPGSTQAAAMDAQAFDAIWHTPALPPRDYCAQFKRTRG